VTAPDKTVDVREEDRFDIDAAHNWVASRVDGLDGRPRYCNFPAAHSNFTYLLTYLGRELILHRPPTGRKAASAHDIRRESACKLSCSRSFPMCRRPARSATIRLSTSAIDRLADLLPLSPWRHTQLGVQGLLLLAVRRLSGLAMP
jgi:hypothetical protein